MMPKTARSIAVVISLFLATQARAEPNEKQAILEVMAQAFAAVESSNPDDWRAIQLAEGSVLSFRQSREPGNDDLEMRMANNETFVSKIAPDGHQYFEQWTSDPIVLVRGPIAVVWGEYEFRVDEQFVHCGVNSIDFAKVDGEWKIANFMWTVETENCPTAPKPPS
ncbi:MAG: hypothetical protein AB8F65_08285 [Woeseiaceae bacterium]